MAKTQVLARRPPSVPKARYENIVRLNTQAKKKAKAVAQDRMGVIVGAVAAAGIGMLEKRGTSLPTVAGIEPTLLYGAFAAFVLPELVKGSAGRMAAEAGAGVLGIAAYKLGKGEPLRVGEDEAYE